MKALARLLALWAISLVWAATAQAQTKAYTPFVRLNGRVLTAESGDSITVKTAQPLSDATVQLFTLPDSTFATGAVSDKEGKFRLLYFPKKQRMNHLLLKVSYLGMESYQRKLTTSLKDQEVNLGDITLHPKSMTLEEAQIVGELKKMYMRGDTLIYNTDAYNMPQGSVLLELVRRLPGLYYNENRVLMYLDKPISEIRLNGEGFFTHDMNIALKNVPVKELDQVKVYETVTEEDKQMGRNRKKQVMDMKTKKNVDMTVLANVAVGAANRDHRYMLDGGINYFKAKGGPQLSLNGNTLNLPGDYDPERPDAPPSFEPNQSKEWTRKKVKLNWKQPIKRVTINQDLTHSYNRQIGEGATSSENYLGSTSLFTEQRNRSNSRNNGTSLRSILSTKLFNGIFLFLGTASDSRSQNASSNLSASFNKNPFDYSDNPLDTDVSALTSIYTNRNEQQSMSRSHRQAASGTISWSKFGAGGKNFLVVLGASYNENDGSSLTQSRTHFFRMDSVADLHRYIQTPTRSLYLNSELRYSFKLRNVHEFDVGYKLNYKQEELNRYTYDLNRLEDNMEWNIVPPGYTDTRVDTLSRQADTRSTEHEVKLTYRSRLSNVNLTIEAALKPKHLHATTVTPQKTLADRGYDFVNRNIWARMEYKQGWTSYTLEYRQNSYEPSAYDLLPIVNDDNPLFIQTGNPDLKQTINHDFSFYFRNGFKWYGILSANIKENTISSQTLYNEKTGARITLPMNINGNWSARAMLDYKNNWNNLTFTTRANYTLSNSVRYVQNMLTTETGKEKGKVRTQRGQLKSDLRYTPEKLELALTAQCDLERSHNELANNKLFTKDYTLTGEFRYYPIGDLELYTSFAYRTRHGYDFTEANMNEGIWNAAIRYKFLKEKTASIRLEGFDLLKQQKSITYNVSSTGNVKSQVFCINRYVLLTFSYRFNVFK